MSKISKSQLLNLGVAVLTIAGMVLGSRAQEAELNELKDEIKMELRKEKEN